MRRGTKVGQAYVALAVDGGDLNNDIADEFDDVEFEKIGRDSKGRFVKGWKDLRNDIGEALTAVTKDFDDMVDRMANAFQKDDAITKGIRSQLNKAFVRGDLIPLIDRIGDQLGVGIYDDTRAAMTGAILDGIEDAMQRQARSGQSINLFATPGDSRVNLPTEDFNRLAAAAERAVIEMRQAQEVSRNLDLDIDIGDRVGRLFGKGSRNNFLNFFGRSLGNIVNIIDKVQLGALSLFKTFNTGFKEAGEGGADFFGKMLAGGAALGGRLGAMLSVITKSGPAAIAAILAIVAALSVMSSVIGAIIGLATAFASVVVSGLTAGLTVLTGAIGATVIAGGLLTAAFMSMTDAQQALLKTAFEPLHAEMIGIGQLMITQMIPSFATWSKQLQEALFLAAPLAQIMGQSFAQAGNSITAALSGPGFVTLAAVLGVQLPNIVRNLTSALGAFMNGAAGMFAGILPHVNLFAKYLSDVATRFSNWANSVQGQNAIADFMDEAVASLRSLWGGIREVSGLIFDVLFSPEAQAAGRRMFDGIRDSFAHYREIVAEAAADGSLQEWFNSAIEFGSALWSVIESLANAFIFLYDSGVLSLITTSLEGLGIATQFVVDLLSSLTGVVTGSPGRWTGLIWEWLEASNVLGGLAGRLRDIYALLGKDAPAANPSGGTANSSVLSEKWAGGKVPKLSMGGLIGAGRKALAGTTKDGAKKEYVNPYEDFANSLIKDTDSTAARIKNAIIDIGKKINEALVDATKSLDVAATRESLTSLARSLKSEAASMVNTAQQALNSAASSLASASSEKSAEKALREVKKAQKDLEVALKNQKKLDSVAKYLVSRQNVTNEGRVQQLMKGLGSQNATLADYVVARDRVTRRLEAANERLAAAVALRDDFRTQVSDSIREFGNLMTAQGQTIGGIEQALTAQDITSNLQSRLETIKKFQDNLRTLTAQGLSNAAYKQILDAGVEAGGATAQALVTGGPGQVQQLNDLVAQIDAKAAELGLETSNRMYQAGVDAAQGLVNGLTSLSAQLDAAAVRLGNTIANALRRALGIKSPSTVLDAMMDPAGDGIVQGLNRQHNKVGTAAQALANQIAVSPQAAAAASQGDPAVSGNQDDPRFRDLHVHTPTENPEAVAKEVLNEVVGRIN